MSLACLVSSLRPQNRFRRQHRLAGVTGSPLAVPPPSVDNGVDRKKCVSDRNCVAHAIVAVIENWQGCVCHVTGCSNRVNQGVEVCCWCAAHDTAALHEVSVFPSSDISGTILLLKSSMGQMSVSGVRTRFQ